MKMNFKKWQVILLIQPLLIAVFLSILQYYSKGGIDSLQHYQLEISSTKFSTLSTMFENLKAIFSGYTLGYQRTLLGFIIFFGMVAAIYNAGNFLVKAINRIFQIQPGISLCERFAINYLIGSAFWSLCWYGLGLSGHLTPSVAWTGLGLGSCSFLLDLPKSTSIQTIFQPFKNMAMYWKNQGWVEKSLFVILVLLLITLTFFSFSTQSNEDVLISHMALPQYYIQTGKIVFDPHHIYWVFRVSCG